jgi:hypothetical protein
MELKESIQLTIGKSGDGFESSRVRISLAAVVPEDNTHSRKEKFDLNRFENGQRMSALLWQELIPI